MRLSALDRKLTRDVWRLRGQLVAIAAVVASGVATFVTMRSTLDSIEAAMADAYATQRFADVFVELERAPERVREDLAAIPGVAAVDTRVVAEVTIDVEGADELISGRMVSLADDDRPQLIVPQLVIGRLPEPRSHREVAVSEAFALAHGLRPGDQLTVVLNERRVDLRLVGIAVSPEFIYALAPGSLVPDDRLFGVLWARRSLLAAAFDMEGAFNDAVLTVARGCTPDAVLDAVDRHLDPYGGLGAALRSDQQSHWFLENELRQLRTLGAMLPLIFLVVATALFAVVLGRLISQQRQEIAVLKAFGYGNLRVAAHFAKLVLAVALGASVLGLVAGDRMGSGMVELYRQFFRFPRLEHFVASPLVLASFLIAIVAAALGAAKALHGVVRMPPAEAMRPPAPPRYRATLVERLGLGRRLSVPARIILRNIERQPLRSLWSVLGTASGGALLFSGLAMTDAVNAMVDLQFRTAQREDVSVTLAAPRAASVMGDFMRLEGVRRAEPFRTVPVRLRSGAIDRRIALEGIPRDATLRPPVDERGRLRSAPERGIALTESLAGVLGLARGDAVTVEVLEGDRRVVDVEVTDVFPSSLGLTARMDLVVLSKLLSEGPSVSGAHLRVDATARAALDAQLKATPLVLGVGSRLDALRRFEETSAESLNFMSFFLVFFSSVLVIGVVYNDARIILALRGRELSSMRVLGYRRSEISGILLGELWLLAAVAIPIGLALGWALAWWTLTATSNELYQLRMSVQPPTYARTAIVMAAAAALAGLVVRRHLDRLDMIEVLKTRA